LEADSLGVFEMAVPFEKSGACFDENPMAAFFEPRA
jgi:hypothetical protein